MFLTDRTGAMQLWTRSARGHESRLTDVDRVGSYSLSADSSLVALVADTQGSQHWGLWVMHADGSQLRPVSIAQHRVHHLVGWTADVREILAFANLRDPRFFDLVAFPLNGEAPRPIMVHDGSGMNAAALPDGGVVVSVHRDRMQHNHLVHIDATGATRLLTPDHPPAKYEKPRAFRDGVLTLSNQGRDHVGVAFVDLKGSHDVLVDAECDVQSLVVSGDRWAYELNREGLAEIHVVADGVDRTVAGHPPGALRSEIIDEPLDLNVNGQVTFELRRYDQPSAIYVADSGGDARLAIAPSMDGIDPEDLPVVEQVGWTSFDGLHIPGFLLRPRSGGIRPTIVDLHGGTGQSRPNWFPWTVALVASGFNVLFPNARGSSGYGRHFQSLDNRERRLDSIRDLHEGARWLVHEGIAPERSIGIMGSSYGGYMTLASIAFFPSTWSAAVDMFGISDYVRHLESLPPWRRQLRETEFGSLSEDRDLLESISPVHRIDAIQAPLLLVHGVNDTLVSISQSEMMVEGMAARGRDVELLRFEDEGHMIHRSENIGEIVTRIVAFFERHLGQ